MEIKYIKVGKLLGDKKIKDIIEMINKINEHVTDIPDSVERKLTLYGSKSMSISAQDFLLDYELIEQNYSGYEVSLFTITGIATEQTWEFFYSSVNDDDTFVETVEDFQPIIEDILQPQIMLDLLSEITELDNSIQQDNEKLSVEKDEQPKKNVDINQAALFPLKFNEEKYLRPVFGMRGSLKPVANGKRIRSISKARRGMTGYRMSKLNVEIQLRSDKGEIIKSIAVPPKKSRAKSYRRRAENLKVNMSDKKTKR
ncbi:hypothetical protein [Bacillus mycoides]|uniref:hypothetical protein n=1 Tax=Bacillus mycoides TaxID=1405 RepID=UPI001C011CE9|nr:hypothetical protein [Bacillus mycoides]QWG35437.1 hypothetical protein EXW30_21855 [Bacillus mycoides]